MVDMIYLLFTCMVIPLILMLFLLEKKSRLTVGFMILGIYVCIFVSGINTLILRAFDNDIYYVTTTFTPITEEIVKALPVILFAFAFSDDRSTLLSISMAVGIGFALLENTYIITSSASAGIVTALIRGFGSGLMHGMCTVAVGYGVSFIRKRRKLFYTGTFALLTAAIIYHATYNCLAQSRYGYVAYIMPIVTYIPFVITRFTHAKKSVE